MFTSVSVNTGKRKTDFYSTTGFGYKDLILVLPTPQGDDYNQSSKKTLGDLNVMSWTNLIKSGN